MVFPESPRSASFKNTWSVTSRVIENSLTGGSRMSGSPPEAMTIVPQYSPVQPTGRSHPATRMRPASAAGAARAARGRARRVVGMAPKISPRCLAAPGPGGVEEQGGGGRWRVVEGAEGDVVAPGGDDGVRDLLEAHRPPEDRGERSLPAPGSPLPAHHLHHRLRPVEQNRSVL